MCRTGLLVFASSLSRIKCLEFFVVSKEAFRNMVIANA